MDKKRYGEEENNCPRRVFKAYNMENETFKDLTNSGETGRRNLKDYYNLERHKALKTIERSENSTKSSKSNIKPLPISPLKSPSRLEKTDYAWPRSVSSFNITDLVNSHTIHLEESVNRGQREAPVHSDVSFKPSEITGRSTLAASKDQRSGRATSSISVEDILSTSFAPNVRKLSLAAKDLRQNGSDGSTLSSSSSSMMSYGQRTNNLLRTADMSQATCSGWSLNGGEGFSIGSVREAVNDMMEGNAFDSKDFIPAELMESKLLTDEISWAANEAAIPTAALSDQAKAKIRREEKMANGNQDDREAVDSTTNGYEPSMMSNSIDFNFSVGSFFQKRSENLTNIVDAINPTKRDLIHGNQQPPDNLWTSSAIVDSSTQFNDEFKAFKEVKSSARVPGVSGGQKKTSPMGAESSYYINMSKINGVIRDINKNAHDPDMDMIQRILDKVKLSDDSECGHQSMGEFKDLSENKENIDPQLMGADTLTFSESMLNNSDCTLMKNRSGSAKKSPQTPRDPLSPLSIPRIKITYVGDENEADIDEWVSPTTKRSGRRTRRSKSPCAVKAREKQRAPTPSSSSNDDDDPVSGGNQLPGQRHISSSPGSQRQSTFSSPSDSQEQKKRLSSTRFDGNHKSTPTAEFNIESPNQSKSASARPSPINRHTSHGSPFTFTISPVSSPRSGFSSRQSSALHGVGGGNASPQFDSTTSTDRQYLSGGESTVPLNERNGMPPPRTNSANSVKSGVSAPTRSSSRCSSSSEFSHRDGKIVPLKVTKFQISWGSTRLRTEAQKSLQVKNTSDKRLVVRVEVRGPGFQIVNVRGNTLTLQSQECSTIVVSFCPTVAGIAIGSLAFYAPKGGCSGSSSVGGSILEIPLYAFGGHSTIMVENCLQGPVGIPFLPLGKFSDLGGPLERSIQLCNRGSLLGFAYLHIDCLGLNLPSDSFSVEPNQVLIPPGQTVTVRCVFRPKREDMKKIIKKITNVIQLACLRIVAGNEANRQRVRRLILRMPTKARISLSPLEGIWSKFPREKPIHDMDLFRESSESAFDLASYMTTHEIALTLNHDFLDESLESSALYMPDADDTIVFRTVCVASTSPTEQNLDPIDELLEATMIQEVGKDADVEDIYDEGHPVSTSQDDCADRRCVVEPKEICFDFNLGRGEDSATLLIRNTFKSRQYFEVINSHPYLFAFTPESGYIEPEGQIQVVVRSGLNCIPQKGLPNNTAIYIHLDSERIEVPVIGRV